MNIFTRISASLSATADKTVSRFENHEAIGAAAIERCRRAVAEARLAERQHQRASERFADRRITAVADIERWTERAAREADSDERTALACLERRQQARQVLESLDAEIERHQMSGENLSQRVRDLESRLDARSTQHATLASRSRLAHADAAINTVDDTTNGIDSLFDRWEASVDVAEMRTSKHEDHLPQSSSVDPLEARMEHEERQQKLAEELDALKGEAARGGEQ